MVRLFKAYNFSSILIALTLLYSCAETCEDCDNPNPSEPFFIANFHNAATESLTEVTVVRFNGIPGSDLSYFEKAASTLNIPLEMNSDTTLIVMEYVTSDSVSLELTDTLVMYYDRRINNREDGKVSVQNTNLRVLSHTFEDAILNCRDTLGICLSDEAKLNLFY